jgi:hypothetical protein
MKCCTSSIKTFNIRKCIFLLYIFISCKNCGKILYVILCGGEERDFKHGLRAQKPFSVEADLYISCFV